MNWARPIEHFGDDLAGWFWSEKFDGFFCEWNGREFLSRAGNQFHAPQSWATAMPRQPLVGELFAGSWKATASALKSCNWAALRFHVFDVPEEGDLLNRLAKIPATLPDFCEVVEHLPVFSTAHALQVMADVSGRGGEGIVCRPPTENHSPVKLKPRMDAEATIIKANFGEYQTIPASYTLERDGQQFKARSSGRLIPPGTLVTFHFRGIDPDGTPRGASVKGERLFD